MAGDAATALNMIKTPAVNDLNHWMGYPPMILSLDGIIGWIHRGCLSHVNEEASWLQPATMSSGAQSMVSDFLAAGIYIQAIAMHITMIKLYAPHRTLIVQDLEMLYSWWKNTLTCIQESRPPRYEELTSVISRSMMAFLCMKISSMGNMIANTGSAL